MKNKEKFLRLFGIITIAMLAYCVFAYIYFNLKLTPDLTELTIQMQTISTIIIPSFVVIGIYHIILLTNALQTLDGKFKDSVYLVLIILSGITLLSDATLLSDMGKEYLLFDITDQWILLYGFTAAHIVTVIWGYIHMIKYPSDKKLFEPSKGSDDRIFVSIHHIGLIAGILGLCGIIFAQIGIIFVPEKFITLFIILVAALALCPFIIFIIFWVIKLKKIPISKWLDEKQLRDSAFAALISFVISILLYAAVCIMDLFDIYLPAATWILGVFFIELIIFSSVMTAKNRQINL